MFERVLIANRGEIALRILRACRTLGIGAVLAYGEADRDSLAAQLADEAICIGPADARRSYLSAVGPHLGRHRHRLRRDPPRLRVPVRGPRLRRGGRRPRPHLRRARPPRCSSASPRRRGPARLLAAHGLPTIPGSEGMLRDDEHALAEAERIGYPVLIKPSAGGGGKGMRMVRTPARAAGRPAASAAPRPGPPSATTRSTWRSGWRTTATSRSRWSWTATATASTSASATAPSSAATRSSSRRRRRRRSPPASRAELAERAIRAVVAAGYENLGTLEFLVDRDQNFYFIEINCRIQVEHPVTEMLTGIDLVATQLRIAAGEPLGFSQADVTFAATPSSSGSTPRTRPTTSGPRPAPSSASTPRAAPASGMDSHLYAGYEVPPFYDSLLGKLIVWGPDRPAAIARGRAALDELVVDGIITNRAFHRAILDNPAFIDGTVTTNLVDRVGGAAFLAAARLRRPVQACIHPAVRRPRAGRH